MITLKCETAISNPPAVVTWFTRGRQLTGAKSVETPSPKVSDGINKWLSSYHCNIEIFQFLFVSARKHAVYRQFTTTVTVIIYAAVILQERTYNKLTDVTKPFLVYSPPHIFQYKQSCILQNEASAT